MNRPVAKYYFKYNGNETEIFPKTVNTVKWKKEDSLLHYFTKEADNIVLYGSGVDLINSMGDEELAEIIIRLYDDNYTNDFAIFNVQKKSGEWDDDNQTVKLPLKGINVLDVIISNWEREYNILSVPGSITTQYNDYIILEWKEERTTDVVTYEPPNTWDIVDTLQRSDGQEWAMILAREKSTVDDGTGGWQLMNEMYYREYTYSFPDLPNRTQLGGTQPSGYEFVLQSYEPIWAESTYIQDKTNTINIPNGRKLKDVIQWMLDKFSTLSYKSTFFQNDNYEDGTAYPDYNYVASRAEGVNIANSLNNIVLHQQSDVKRYTATEHATIQNISLKQLLQDLSAMFNGLKCFIDINGDFRIEHKSYFDYQNGIDLTQIVNSKGVPYINKQNKYTYDKTNIPQFIELKFKSSLNADNKGLRLEQLADTVEKGKVNSASALQISTDIRGILANPDEFPDAGIFMFVLDSTNTVLEETNKYSNKTYGNAHLSVPNLMYYYFREQRDAANIVINNNIFNSVSLKKIKQQSDLMLPYQVGIDLFKLHKTELGWGEVDESEINLKNGMMKLKLIHE